MKRIFSILLIAMFSLFLAVDGLWATPPTVQSRYLGFSNIGATSAKVSFARGNGYGRIVVAHYGGTADWNAFLTSYLTPLDVSGNFLLLTDAAGNRTDAFADADNKYTHTSGTYLVIDILTGTSRVSNLSNLESNTSYDIRVFEYNISGTDADFYTASATNNPRSFQTYTVTPPSGLSVSPWSEGGMFKWTTDGTNADGYLISIYQGSTVVADYENVDIGDPSDNQYPIFGLTANTEYSVWVRSYDANNNLSTWANTGAFTTLTNPGGTITFSPADGTTVGIGGTITATLTATNLQWGLLENTATTINGVATTNFTDNGNGTYTFTYTVVEGNTDRADATDAIPTNFDLEDGNGVAFSAAISSVTEPNAPGIDAHYPTITNVTSSTTDGEYGIGSAISVTVIFSEAVSQASGGTATLTLETGTTDRTVTRTGGWSAGTNVLLGNYDVFEGDVSADLDYVATTSFTATTDIVDAGGNVAILTLPTPAASGSLGANKAIVIDGVRPTVTSITRNGATECTNATSVTYRVTFSENIATSSLANTDFVLSGTPTGTIGTPSVVTANSVFDVAVSGITGNGTLRLDFTGSVTDDVTNNPNASTASFTSGESYNIDQTAPTAAITSPIATNCYNATSIPATITGTGADAVYCNWIQSVEVAIWLDANTNGTFDTGDGYWNGTDWTGATATWNAATTTDYYATWSWTHGLTFSNGRYYIQTRITDAAGNVTTSTATSYYFTYDNTAPVISNISSISENEAFCVKTGTDNLTITFDVAETNALSANPTVGIYDGATLLGTATYSGYTSPTFTYTYSVPAGNYANVDIKVDATDCAGNTDTETLADAFSIDNTAPVFSGLSDGTATCANSGDVVTITFNTTEACGLATNPTVTITDASDNTIGTATFGSIASGLYTYTYAVGTGNYANCKVKVNATDDAGNVATESVLSPAFSIDNTAPVFANLADNATCVNYLDVVTITFNTTEACGLATNPTVTITDASDNTIGTATFGSIASGLYTYTYAVGTGNYANCKVKVNATDDAGNVATEAVLSPAFSIDNIAPAFSGLSDGTATCVNSGDVVTISFNTTEACGLTTNPTVIVTSSADVQIGANATFVSNVSGLYTYTYAVGTGDYQNCKVKVNATDDAGNVATEAVLSPAFNIDNTLPVISIDYPTNTTYTNGTQLLDFTLTETNQVTTEASYDNTNWTTVSDGVTALSAITGWSSITDGSTFTLYVRHTDCAGNVGYDQVDFTKDVTAPTISSLVESCDNATAVVTFSEPVYSAFTANTPSGDLTIASDVSLTVSGGEGVLNTVTFAHTAGNATGTFSMTWTSTVNGLEQLQVAAQTTNAIYDRAGNAMAYPTTSSDYANTPVSVNTNPSSQSACFGTTATFTASGTGGHTVSYQWEYWDGSAYTNVTDGSGYNTPTYTTPALTNDLNGRIYRVKIYNECFTEYTTTATLTVTPATAITTQPVSTSICYGSTANLSVVAEGGNLAYQWQSTTDGGSTWYNVSGATSSSLALSGLAVGTYTYRVIVYGSCAPTTVTSDPATVTVNALPTAGISYTGSPYCATGTASVTLTGQTGGTYSSTTGLVISSSTGEINLATSTAGTYTVTYTFSNGTCSNTTTTSVTINALPTATISYTGSPYCATGTASVTLTGQTGGTYSSTTGLSINSSTGEIDLVESTPGTYTVTYTFSNGTCSNTTTTTITLYPLPTVYTTSNGGDNAECVGNDFTVYLSNSETTATYYLMRFDGSTSHQLESKTGTGSSISFAVTNAVAGVYTITAVSNHSCQANMDGGVTVYENPTATITAGGATTFCEGGSVTLSAPIGEGYTYLWSNESTTSSITVTESGSYTVTVTNANGCSTTSSATVVTVNPLPTAPSSVSSSASAVCINDNGNITLTATGGSGTTLEWSTASDFSSTIGTGTPLVVASPTVVTTYYARWTTLTCGNSAAASTTVTINPLPGAAGSITGDASVTGGDQNVVYSISAVTNATGYTWTYTGSGATITNNGTSIEIDFATTATGGTLTVTPTNGCGNGTSSSLAITVGTPSTPTKLAVLTTVGTQTSGTAFNVQVQAQDASSNPSPVSANTTVTFSINTGTGTVSGSGTISSGSHTATISVTYTKAAGETGVILSADATGLTSGLTNAFTVIPATEPTTQVTNIYMQSRTTARINIAFTAGNGDGRLVIYKAGTTNLDVPTDGTIYVAGDAVGTSTVVAVGDITTASQTGLTNGTWYTFNVFEYEGTGAPNYNVTLVQNENRKYIKTLPKEFAEGETYVMGDQLAMGGINPNPVNADGFILDVYTPESGDVVLEIVSVDGTVIYSNTANLGQGSHFIKLSLDNEKGGNPAGTYFVKITGFGETLQQKFIYMP